MDWCSILPWLIGIGSAILGGLIGYYLTRPKTLFYKSEFENKSNDYDNLNSTYGATLSAKAETEQLNVDLNAQLEAEKNRANSLQVALDEELALRQKVEADLERSLGEITALNERIEAKNVAINDIEGKMTVALAAAKDDCAKKEAALNKNIVTLKADLDAKNAELKKGEEKLSFAASNEASLADLKTQLETNIKDYEGQIVALKASSENKDFELTALQTKLGELEATLAAKEADWSAKVANAETTASTNLGAKEAEIEALRVKLGEVEANFATKEANLNLKIQELEEEATANLSSRGIVMGTGVGNNDEFANIKANLGLIPFAAIGSSAATADDLEKINSITATDEVKLNLAQINSFKQISRLQDEEITAVANATGLDADRIKNEDWAGQARLLLAGAIVDKDDLTKIEGIGPKISGLCNNNGIYTFEELANTSVSELKHVLKQGGNRYRLANPGTWPMQARLAADGEWEQLRILQDVLDGGVFREAKPEVPAARGIVMEASPINMEEITNIKANLGQIPFGSIGSAAATADNLEQINTIEAIDEMKLNLAQINSFKQLSRLQDEEVEAVANVIGVDAGRIKSEDWVGQARQLLAAAAVEKDDLKKVEGIGPKIEGLCNNNGIYTFEELANTSVTALKHVLKEGGKRFRLANPGTWPMQARLAADGEWEQLEILQDVLDGGIFKK